MARVWLVDPELKTITVHQPNAEPVLYNVTQTIADDPALPGLRLNVAKLFRSRSVAHPS